MNQRSKKPIQQNQSRFSSIQQHFMDIESKESSTKSTTRSVSRQRQARKAISSRNSVVEIIETSCQTVLAKKSIRSRTISPNIEIISTRSLSLSHLKASPIVPLLVDDEVVSVTDVSRSVHNFPLAQSQKNQTQTQKQSRQVTPKPSDNTKPASRTTRSKSPKVSKIISVMDLNLMIDRLEEGMRNKTPRSEIVKKLVVELNSKPAQVENWIHRILSSSQSIITQLKSIVKLNPERARAVRPLIRKFKNHQVLLLTLARPSKPSNGASTIPQLGVSGADTNKEEIEIEEVIDLDALLLKKRSKLSDCDNITPMSSHDQNVLERKLQILKWTLRKKILTEFVSTQLALFLKGMQSTTRCSQRMMLKILDAFGKENLSFKCLVDWALSPCLGYRVIWKIDC